MGLGDLAGIGLLYAMPVRMSPEVELPLACDGQPFDLPAGHPLRDVDCLACTQPLGQRTIVLVLVGMAPAARGRLDAGGCGTGCSVPVHEDCAGYGA
jgi:hypothetical protein